MKKNTIIKIIILTIISMFATNVVSHHDSIIIDSTIPIQFKTNKTQPIYDNIWGAIYHAVEEQCDDTPLITGDGSKINPHAASEHRWIAISQSMLNCEYRQKLLGDTTSMMFKGKIKYGDTIWIDSPYDEINGMWVVRDTKNKRYVNSIDFLQTKGDGRLYNNNPLWDGKFDDIQIYTLNDAIKLGLNS